ncbi:MAG: hypothetical protein ACRDKU_07075 [Gaiellaceae bacterium]
MVLAQPKIGTAVFAAAAVIAAFALIATPDARGGLLSTGKASVCETQASQPFAPWGDRANYVLIPGGSFESGTTQWSLSGGATTFWGNEPYYVHGAQDGRSLVLPPGSSATTPSMCFAIGDWHARFFAVNNGVKSSRLKVTVQVRSLLGVLSILDGGTVANSGVWEPSPRIQLLLSNVTSLLGTKAVSFRFAPTGLGLWRIDDVYLDPFKST